MLNGQKKQRYEHVQSRKCEGAHYTPELFADFISTKIVQNFKFHKTIKIVDPAVGDGELLISLISIIKRKTKTTIKVYGFDTNAISINIAKARLKAKFPTIFIEFYNKDFLQVCLEKGDLFCSDAVPEFDLLIANPPYIRTQVLGAEQSKLLSNNFGLKGRVDIYQAFLVAMNAVLSPTGIAGVIVSNRFLTTKGASKFREILHRLYKIDGIWDFGDTKVFEAAVLPVVMTLSKAGENNGSKIPFSSIYDKKIENIEQIYPNASHQIEALNHEGIVKYPKGHYHVKHGYLTFDSNPSDIWRIQDTNSREWLNEINRNTWMTFKDVGKIRVGVKTTADKVFIRSNWVEDIGYEPELIRPLITHHVAGRFCASKKISKKGILYTHTIENGKRRTYDIEQYPLTKKYLYQNKEQLAGRSYVIKANREWFEIWVPQNPSLWSQPKIVFRDITEKPMFWLDEEGSVVNGDCYWMVPEYEDTSKNILWLILAIANSTFIEEFYDIKFQNKLYSNKRRFITQYVEQFPLPNPERSQSKKLISMAKKRYLETDSNKQDILEAKINELVWSTFNVEKPFIPLG